MLEMAQSLHLPVVIEGVETDKRANMLRRISARHAQDFHYRPMQAEDFEALLDGGNGQSRSHANATTEGAFVP